MALTLSKIMQRTWRELGHLVDITATGGSTTTVVDTTLSNRYTSDDALIGGTAIVTYDAGGAAAAPEGEFQRISDYVASTQTFTVGTAFSTGVAAGDKVGLARPTIPHEQMRQAVNDGLANLGTISLVDTSITLVAGTYTYNLPVGLKIRELRDILIYDGSDLYRSIKGLVSYVPSAAGSVGTLQFSQIPEAQPLKIIYEGIHPALTVHSSVISETIQEELAVAAAMDKALTWLVSKRGDSALGTFLLQRWNDAKTTLQQQKTEKPVNRSKPAPKWFIA
jgi:hypothetical protein